MRYLYFSVIFSLFFSSNIFSQTRSILESPEGSPNFNELGSKKNQCVFNAVYYSGDGLIFNYNSSSYDSSCPTIYIVAHEVGALNSVYDYFEIPLGSPNMIELDFDFNFPECSGIGDIEISVASMITEGPFIGQFMMYSLNDICDIFPSTEYNQNTMTIDAYVCNCGYFIDDLSNSGFEYDNLNGDNPDPLINIGNISTLSFQQADDIRLYPNPLSGNKLIIDSNDQEVLEYKIFSLNEERVIVSDNLNNDKFHINSSLFVSGLNYIELKFKNGKKKIFTVLKK